MVSAKYTFDPQPVAGNCVDLRLAAEDAHLMTGGPQHRGVHRTQRAGAGNQDRLIAHEQNLTCGEYREQPPAHSRRNIRSLTRAFGAASPIFWERLTGAIACGPSFCG